MHELANLSSLYDCLVNIILKYNFDTLDEPISINEVIRGISKKLKNGKARGSDLLSNEIIKLSVKVLPSYFVKLFNAILSKGVFPAS